MQEPQSIELEICVAARELWLRGLIAGCDGLISVEHHRRRYVATPPARRLSSLEPTELLTVDVGGLSVESNVGIDQADWLPHRLAYQKRVDNGADAVRSTVMACPPMTLALIRKRGRGQPLSLPHQPDVAMAEGDEASIRQAIADHRVTVVADRGVLVTGRDLAEALNTLEQIEHAATVELACL
ncbi:MAG: hypothetical protein CMJ18_25700 [Phycisphaeraceae bacterium]|nr:hypothetical protein [Phycisphaeraceae bacterium]